MLSALLLSLIVGNAEARAAYDCAATAKQKFGTRVYAFEPKMLVDSFNPEIPNAKRAVHLVTTETPGPNYTSRICGHCGWGTVSPESKLTTRPMTGTLAAFFNGNGDPVKLDYVNGTATAIDMIVCEARAF